ncbi:pyridoxamine 5'-phosphate oxidase family protein [Actinomadura rupiterrae]|uniref:pyridoxamine 5'-phosphate oxidase family protein n=1 Tax=Actinomadura rupiterrae TaxID=559627 RepID=UPI0020A25BF7|nr:pyridoxamine 5'-phosphate oxidase family protein [Actinomadura rupiterrae]MCP2335936.1 nitroimidazol reductase NimA-like FMN-containing flavoprotein (pyridoxamine 5'-phosphate oxidase superfamily) [Actinomadura rupiterrae]
MSEPQGRPTLSELDREACLALIAPGGVGRVAFDDGEGPSVLPVNYVMDGEEVVFRTSLAGRLNQKLAGLLSGAEVRIAFEVDDFDSEMREGWSVLLRGGARQLGDEEDSAPVEPWPADARPARIRLNPKEITGRRLTVA